MCVYVTCSHPVNIFFLPSPQQELGGEPPMGADVAGAPGSRDARGRPGLGHHDRDRDRDRHRDRDSGPPGSDPCHLYVGYIAAHVTDQMLEGLFRR